MIFTKKERRLYTSLEKSSELFFLIPPSMTAVSLLKLFNILTGCCLALQMAQGRRFKESMETHDLYLLPLGFFVV